LDIGLKRRCWLCQQSIVTRGPPNKHLKGLREDALEGRQLVAWMLTEVLIELFDALPCLVVLVIDE
jgi:hypothetical protein